MPFICKECCQYFVVNWVNELFAWTLVASGVIIALLGIASFDPFFFFMGLVIFIVLVIYGKVVSASTLSYCSDCSKKLNDKIIQELIVENPAVGRLLQYQCKYNSNRGKVIDDSNIEYAKSAIDDINSLINYGKYQEAIIKLENYGLDEEAAAVRKKSRIITTINLDVNELVDQINEYGSVKSLKCNNCGAPIENEEILAGKKFCSFCGGAFDLLSVNEILREMLNPMIPSKKLSEKTDLKP